MKKLIVLPDITIKEAFKILSNVGEKCLIVADENKIILGTLSDGDLRKAILKGAVIGDAIAGIFQQNPTVIVENEYKLEQAKELFIKNRFDIIPLVDREGKVLDVLVWDKVFKNEKNKERQQLDIPVVIMAGGKGTRMEPFTKILPKPLVPVHEKPIIELIIDRFTELGCSKFYLTVNYKGKILKAYFEELQPGYQVNFIEEQEPLGTAGSLRYLNDYFNDPFFVTNCDIIISADYSSLYEFHKKGGYDITLVASTKEYVIPYGTCELNSHGHLSHINEKPKYDFLINTGLYVMNPAVLNIIPKRKFYHITHLIEDAKNNGKNVGVFPIDDDDWIDVGQWTEYQKAITKL